MAEVAATLQQTEAARVFNREAADRQVFRVVQRTPDPLAIGCLNRQTAGVVQLATVVENFRRLVGAEQVHAGQRRNAQFADLFTQEHARLHVDQGVGARTQGQFVGASGARGVEQREDHQMLFIRVWLLDPEFGKTREFFTRRHRSVDGHAASGQAIHLTFADDAEVARAQHGHDFVLLVVLVDRISHAETGPTEVFGRFRVELHAAEIETVRVVLDFVDGGRGHFIDLHRRVEVHALVIERDLERRLVSGPFGLVLQEADLLVVRKLHVAEFRRKIALGRYEFLSGQIFGLCRHVVQIERPELAGAEQTEQSRPGQQNATQALSRGLWCITWTNNHEQPSPKTDEETNGQPSNAGLASIVPTPKGANDSPNDFGPVCVFTDLTGNRPSL